MIHLSHIFHTTALRLCALCCMATANILHTAAADYGWAWIGAPQPEAGQHYWFRHTYTRLGNVQHATLRIATTGYAQVYVNGRNVCTDPITPARRTPGNAPLARTYDVTAFTRQDSVTIAVWYAPACAASDVGYGATAAQIALCLYGADDRGQAFAVQTDSSWLCRPAPMRCTGTGLQLYDGRQSVYDWATADTEWALWRPSAARSLPAGVHTRPSTDRCRVHRLLTASLQAKGDTCLQAVFTRPFAGLLRITLRGAVSGEHLYVHPWLTYLCSGGMDEQACLRFTPARLGTLVLKGDTHFRPSQVQNVEGLEIAYFHDAF